MTSKVSISLQYGRNNSLCPDMFARSSFELVQNLDTTESSFELVQKTARKCTIQVNLMVISGTFGTMKAKIPRAKSNEDFEDDGIIAQIWLTNTQNQQRKRLSLSQMALIE